MADGEQGYIPVYSVSSYETLSLHRGHFWGGEKHLCFHLLNRRLGSAVDTVEAKQNVSILYQMILCRVAMQRIRIRTTYGYPCPEQASRREAWQRFARRH